MTPSERIKNIAKNIQEKKRITPPDSIMYAILDYLDETRSGENDVKYCLKCGGLTNHDSSQHGTFNTAVTHNDVSECKHEWKPVFDRTNNTCIIRYDCSKCSMSKPTDKHSNSVEVEEFAEELFSVCEYPDPRIWKDISEDEKDVWKIKASIIIQDGYSKRNAIRFPEKKEQCRDDERHFGYMLGWNACLDEMRRLNNVKENASE